MSQSGQHKVFEKSNEITANPKLLDLLAVEGNQGLLEQAFNEYFHMGMLQNHDGDSYSTQEKSRSRQETRLALVNEDLSVLATLNPIV